jgi:hypothetical protein
MRAHRPPGACRRSPRAVVAAVALLAALLPTGPRPAQAASLDGVVRAVLDEVDAHGWNPAVGGLYINWSIDDPSQANQPDQVVTRHDSLTDLRDLVNMAWYERRHPGDVSQAAAIARLAPVVAAEFRGYATDKGWVYWQLLQLADLGQGAVWAADARAFALHLATAVDPATGVAHGPLSASTAEAAASCPDGYRVDHDLESGLALVDAGVRFASPQWRAVGAREVDVVTDQTFDAVHHLYDRIVCQGAVWDAHAKLGEQADEIVALLSVGAAAGVPADIARAEQMLDELAGPAGGLHDTVQGGYYASLDMASGAVATGYKETRQLTLLTGLHRADALTGGRYAALEREMTAVALDMETATPLAGYPYREPAGFGFFHGERWITTEAAGIALEALQTVLGGGGPARRVTPPAPRVPPPGVAVPPPAATPAPSASPPPVPAEAAPARPGPRTGARAPGGQAPWPLVAVLASLGAAGAVAVTLALRRRRATGR